MNEELQTWLTDAAQRGGAFVEREAPLYAQEIVAWTFWSGIIQSLLCLAFALAGSAIWVLLFRWFKKNAHESNEIVPAVIIAMVLLPLLGVFPVIFGIGGVVSSVKASVAPRTVIVEHLRGLAK